MKGYLKIALVAAVTIAVISRVPQLRGVVMGG